MLQSLGTKVFLIVVTLTTLILPLKTESIKSLLDLPLALKQANWLIHATLTDQDNGDQYFIQEFISAQRSTIKGKIVTSSERGSFDIHYAFPSIGDNIIADGPDTNRRLVIHDSQCSSFEYKNSWDSDLPGVSKPLTNLILLIGPSILFRIDHEFFIWQDSPQKDVRGTMMKSANTMINHKLNITYYYKRNLDIQTGIQQPSRIEFSGNDPGQIGSSVAENLILDIYLQKQDFQDDFNNLVQPLPGVGCPYYFEENLPLPELKTDYIHMMMDQYAEGQVYSTSTSEIFASNKYKVMRLMTKLVETEQEAVYDYSLGVIFMVEKHGECSVYPITLSSPGLNSARQFNISSLFLLDGDYRYLGQINWGHRSGFPVKVWESVRYDANIEDQKYDKTVITQYFAESAGSDLFSGHILVSTTVTGYTLDSGKNYIYIQKITRDYLDVQTSGADAESHDIFSLSECVDINSKLNLKFKLACTETNCIKIAEENVYKLKEEFKDSIVTNYNLSPLRIDDIQISFTENEIFISTNFLETPNLITWNVYKPKTVFISDETLAIANKVTATGDFACLDLFADSNDVVISCGISTCGSLAKLEDIKEDSESGHACSVYTVPLHNWRRLKQEASLKDLQTSLLQSFLRKRIYLNDPDATYKVVDIIEETAATDANDGQLFELFSESQKIVPDDLTNMEVPNVNTFGDCYRACVYSDDLNCHTFTYCQNGDGTIECRVSNVTIYQLTLENRNRNDGCSTYKRNSILDYSIISNRRFKNPGSAPASMSLTRCAELCSASKDCVSFEFCGTECTFAGYYTDSITTYTSDCHIYTPKAANSYEITGQKVAFDVMHTEMNLNLDQCASLCSNWADDDSNCSSFNFCPRSRSASTCSLSKYSVKSSDTKTVNSGDCYNYELKSGSSTSVKNAQSTSSQSKDSTSKTAAYGIVMLFLCAGLLLGFVAPFIYQMIKQVYSSKYVDLNFKWSRHFDDQTENVQMDRC